MTGGGAWSGAWCPVILGRVVFGPEFGYRMARGDGITITPFASLKGVWDFEGADSVPISGAAVSSDNFRGLAEAGIRMTSSSGLLLDLSGSYDGLGSSTFEAWSGQARVRVPLN